MVEIFTDGAYAISIDQGGAAAVVVKDKEVIHKSFLGLTNTTNNRMELYGLILGLRYILNSEETDFKIYSDSQYVISTLTKGWNKKKNLDIWNIVDIYLNKIKDKNIEYLWVKGHDGNDFNEIADLWAVHASHLLNVEKDEH